MMFNYFLNSSHHRRIAFEEAMDIGLFPIADRGKCSRYDKGRISTDAIRFFALSGLRVSCFDCLSTDDYYHEGYLETEFGMSAYEAAKRLATSLFKAKKNAYQKYMDVISKHIDNGDLESINSLFLGDECRDYDCAFAWMVENEVISLTDDGWSLADCKVVCDESPKVVRTIEWYASAFA